MNEEPLYGMRQNSLQDIQSMKRKSKREMGDIYGNKNMRK